MLRRVAQIVARHAASVANAGVAPFHTHASPLLLMPKARNGRVNYTYPSLAKHTRLDNLNGRERRKKILENLKRRPRSKTGVRKPSKGSVKTTTGAAAAAVDTGLAPTTQGPSLKLLERNAQKSFHEIGVRDDIIAALQTKAIVKPTEIQALGIPEILKGRDVLLAAETGSGKTFAYVLPVLQRLKDEEASGFERRFSRPRALILVPSRELAQQVLTVVKSLTHSVRLRVIALSGVGVRKHERDALDSLVDIVVATPGRLLEHRNAGTISLADVRLVVIDEADTMLNAGFSEDMNKIILPVQSKASDGLRHFITVTATLPKPVDRFIATNFANAVRVTTPSLHRTVPTLRQRFVTIRGHGGPKHVQLLGVMNEAKAKRTLIFCNTTGSSVALNSFLRDRKINSVVLHGDLAPPDRSEHLEKFIKGEASVLVATDIASRGLDTINVDHVILFDFPHNAIDYLHRVGRTARNGSMGRATSLISRRDRKLATLIANTLRRGKALGWAPSNQASNTTSHRARRSPSKSPSSPSPSRPRQQHQHHQQQQQRRRKTTPSSSNLSRR